MRNFLLLLGFGFLLTSCGDAKKDFTLQQNNLRILAEKINNDFLQVHYAVDTIAMRLEKIYRSKDSILPLVDSSQYEIDQSSGVMYRKDFIDNSAVYVSGLHEITKSVKEYTYITEAIDPTFKEIAKKNSVVQVYYNDRFSGNRIYPPFDVLTQYEPGLDISSYNFYYLADEEHNPERTSLWLDDIYVDPAGRGWMISVIAPVYYNNELYGVAGIDVTIKSIIKQYLPKNDKYTIIVDSEGNLIAAGPEALFLYGMPTLKDYEYTSTIKEEEILGEEFNIQQSKNGSLRNAVKEILNNTDVKSSKFNRADVSFQLISAPIAEFDWYLLQAVEI